MPVNRSPASLREHLDLIASSASLAADISAGLSQLERHARGAVTVADAIALLSVLATIEQSVESVRGLLEDKATAVDLAALEPDESVYRVPGRTH